MIPYDARVPTNLLGVRVSAMRLRSGSLRTRGVLSYKEFEIPIGVVEEPYVKRLVLVSTTWVIGLTNFTLYPVTRI